VRVWVFEGVKKFSRLEFVIDFTFSKGGGCVRAEKLV